MSAPSIGLWQSCFPLFVLRFLSLSLFSHSYMAPITFKWIHYTPRKEFSHFSSSFVLVIFVVHYRTHYTQSYCFIFVAVQWTTVDRYLFHMCYALISSLFFIRSVCSLNFDHSLLSKIYDSHAHVWIHWKQWNKTNRVNDHFISVIRAIANAHTNLDILTHQ